MAKNEHIGGESMPKYDYFNTLFILDEKLEDNEAKVEGLERIIEGMKEVSKRLSSVVTNDDSPADNSIKKIIAQNDMTIKEYEIALSRLKYRTECISKVVANLDDEKDKFLVETILEAYGIINEEGLSVEDRVAKSKNIEKSLEKALDDEETKKAD